VAVTHPSPLRGVRDECPRRRCSRHVRSLARSLARPLGSASEIDRASRSRIHAGRKKFGGRGGQVRNRCETANERAADVITRYSADTSVSCCTGVSRRDSKAINIIRSCRCGWRSVTNGIAEKEAETRRRPQPATKPITINRSAAAHSAKSTRSGRAATLARIATRTRVRLERRPEAASLCLSLWCFPLFH